MGSDVFNILFTIFLVFLNGFFVAAEFAIVKVRASQVETKSLTGNKVAKNALRVINNLDAYLSATQLGITLASLALGWVGEPFVAELVRKAVTAMGFHFPEATIEGIAFGVAFTFITVMHIVFGELAPKSIAIRYPEKTTMVLSAPLRAFYLVFKPFIWVLNGFANFILKVIGIPLVHEQDTHTEEEIRLLLEESKKSGNIKSTEHELLENVFKFDDRTAEQIMIPRTKMITVEINTSVDDVVKSILDEGYSRMPVYKDSVDNIVGILHTKDVLKAILKDKANAKIEDLMREPYFVLEKKSINLILRELQREHAQMAIVLDEFGGTSGILTMEDIVEELVVYIQD
ncbi:MAG: hemolysin family protein [Bacteroidota bacterium]